MIKFWTHPYTLIPWDSNNQNADQVVRKGALLKVQWPSGNIGYSDVCPWPEFGDLVIEEQLSALAKGRLSPLLEQSIWLAKKDAALRKQGKNAFVGVAKVKNHYLVKDLSKFADSQMKEVRGAGFTTLKIKVGQSIDDEAKHVIRLLRQNPILVRLDFNAKTDFSQFERFLSHFGASEKPRIEFVEDPLPWDLEAWREASKFAPLAVDLEYHKIDWEKISTKPPFSTLVVKPARLDVDKALHWINKFALKMVVTSSLDHPIGNAHALSVATELKKFYPNTLLDCGCLTLRSYKPNEFTARVQTVGPYLKEISGTGIGFDDLLERIEWTPLQK